VRCVRVKLSLGQPSGFRFDDRLPIIPEVSCPFTHLARRQNCHIQRPTSPNSLILSSEGDLLPANCQLAIADLIRRGAPGTRASTPSSRLPSAVDRAGLAARDGSTGPGAASAYGASIVARSVRRSTWPWKVAFEYGRRSDPWMPSSLTSPPPRTRTSASTDPRVSDHVIVPETRIPGRSWTFLSEKTTGSSPELRQPHATINIDSLQGRATPQGRWTERFSQRRREGAYTMRGGVPKTPLCTNWYARPSIDSNWPDPPPIPDPIRFSP
jgi:hypothetical protein